MKPKTMDRHAEKKVFNRFQGAEKCIRKIREEHSMDCMDQVTKQGNVPGKIVEDWLEALVAVSEVPTRIIVLKPLICSETRVMMIVWTIIYLAAAKNCRIPDHTRSTYWSTYESAYKKVGESHQAEPAN